MAEDSIDMVAEFHEAFNCFTMEEPSIPSLGYKDVNDLRMLAAMLNVVKQEAYIMATERLGAGLDMNDMVNLMLQNTSALPPSPIHSLFTRIQLISEELAEWAEAVADEDIVEAADATGDLDYVVNGTWLSLGMQGPKELIMEEIHRSNMAKLVDGKPMVNEAGRVVKPPG